MFVTIANEPFMVFLKMGKQGGCAAAHLEAVQYLINQLQDPLLAIRGLRGISCYQSNGEYISCVEALGQALEEHYQNLLPQPNPEE